MAEPTGVGPDRGTPGAASTPGRAPGWRGDRRRFLAGAGGAGLGALLASTACFGGGSDDPTPVASATAGAVRRGGTLRMGQGADPILTAGYPFSIVAQNRILLYATSETLVDYAGGLTTSPVLAERFEVSSDFRRVSVTLKPGLQFHNGQPVTSDDVLFSVQTVQDPASAGLSTTVQFELAGLARAITTAKVVDSRTVEFTFDEPRTNLGDFFTQLQITHRGSYPELARGTVVGTGPFRLAKWDRARGFRLERFADWHGAGSDARPYLDAIEVSIFPDQTASTIAFRSGNLDAYLAMSAPNAAPLRKDGKTRIAGKTGMNYLGMNVTNPVLQDRRVRQAIFYAINRERMVRDAGQDFGTVTTQPWPSTSPAFDPAREAPLFDPQRARDLLARAGFAQADELMIEYPAGITLQEVQAQLAQADLMAVGIKTRLAAVEGVRYSQRLRARDFSDFWMASHVGGDLTPLTLFQQTLEFRPTENLSSFEDSAYASLVRRLETLAPTSQEARDVYGELNRFMQENPFVVPTGIPQTRIDLVQDDVLGWPSQPADYAIAPTGKVDFSRVSLR